MPPSGTLSVDIYVSDVVLFALLVPWIVQLSLRERRLYFPKAAYVVLLFLAWAVIISLLEAPSLYLAAFEFIRKLLYFILFLYIVNNVETTTQFRAVILALLIGLAIEAAVVIALFFLGIGGESYLFKGVLQGTNSSSESLGSLTVSEAGSWKNVKRSSGTFAHPSMAAYYFEYILPIVLASFLTVRRTRYRVLTAMLYLAGLGSLVLTFSRSAIVGFLIACAVFLPVARWAGLIPQRVFARFAIGAVALLLAGTPLLVNYLMTRPEALALRFRILEPALDAFAKRPLWGGGLNNSTALTEGSRVTNVLPTGHTEYTSIVVHNYHVIVLLDVGIFGYLLYAGFFLLICFTALRQLRGATPEMKILSVGIVSALVGIWIHNLADPFGGHALQAMWWLEAGLIFAIYHAVTRGKGSAAGISDAGGSNRTGPAGLALGRGLSGMPGVRANRPGEYRR
jgi:O-antigen ligase